jgi:hypothetical protein
VHCRSAAVAHGIANGICYHRGAGGGAAVLLWLLSAQVGHGTRDSNAALEAAGARILGAGRKVPGVVMPAVESASAVEEDAPAENAAPAPGAMHSCRFSAGHGQLLILGETPMVTTVTCSKMLMDQGQGT